MDDNSLTVIISSNERNAGTSAAKTATDSADGANNPTVEAKAHETNNNKEPLSQALAPSQGSNTTDAANTTLTTVPIDERKPTNNKPESKGSFKTQAPSSQDQTRIAYATLLADINPSNPYSLKVSRSYFGYLLHLAVLRKLADDFGMKHDFVILFHLSRSYERKDIPQIQKDYLDRLNFTVYSIPKRAAVSKWGSKMDLKFHLLKLTQYDQILFMDADVIPLCNVDYVFDLSANGTIAKNVIMCSIEPAQGGWFLMETGGYDEIRKLKWHDEEKGFGVELPAKDPAIGSKKKKYTKYTWHGANVDQGLLYHWMRFVKRTMSVSCDREVLHYENGTKTKTTPFPHKCPNKANNILLKDRDKGTAFMQSDQYHFTGNDKPWVHMYAKAKEEGSAMTFWQQALKEAWRKYGLPSPKDLMAGSGLSDSQLARAHEFVFSQP